MTLPAAPQKLRLSSTQRQVLYAIIHYYEKHNCSPSIRNLRDAVHGINTTSAIAYQLEKLEEKGLIEIHDLQSRGIQITGGRYLVPDDTRRLAGL